LFQGNTTHPFLAVQIQAFPCCPAPKQTGAAVGSKWAGNPWELCSGCALWGVLRAGAAASAVLLLSQWRTLMLSNWKILVH